MPFAERGNIALPSCVPPATKHKIRRRSSRRQWPCFETAYSLLQSAPGTGPLLTAQRQCMGQCASRPGGQAGAPEAKQTHRLGRDPASTPTAVVADESAGLQKHTDGCQSEPEHGKQHIDAAWRQESLDGVASARAETPHDDVNGSASAIATPPPPPLPSRDPALKCALTSHELGPSPSRPLPQVPPAASRAAAATSPSSRARAWTPRSTPRSASRWRCAGMTSAAAKTPQPARCG